MWPWRAFYMFYQTIISELIEERTLGIKGCLKFFYMFERLHKGLEFIDISKNLT
jgi:hypothetical protein